MLNWLEKDYSQQRTQFDCDVVISLERRKGLPMLLFRFRKNSIYKIISNEEFIVIAKDGPNIYFKESDSKKGFKVGNYSPSIKSIKIKHSRFPLKEEDLGEYNIEFDTKLGLHYICLRRKLEKQLNWEGR